MTDETANTADLTMDEKLDRILQRLDALEARADDRARETRPLLDHLIQEMVTTRETLMEELRRIKKQLEVMTPDVMQVRADQRRLEDRMDVAERRPN
jgi:ABC-type transporter Mla subunit MlaD